MGKGKTKGTIYERNNKITSLRTSALRKTTPRDSENKPQSKRKICAKDIP